MKEEEMQKLYLEFQMLSHHINQLEKQNTMLNNQLMELMATSQSLEDAKDIEQGTEILVPLSSGIYAKAELKDNKNLIPWFHFVEEVEDRAVAGCFKKIHGA